MKLLTKIITNKLPKLYSQEANPNPKAVLKFFTPWSNWTWYITEGEKQEDGDWMFFGKVVSPICPDGELGYTLLSQLKEIKGPAGLLIERDMHWSPTPLDECKY